MSVVLRPAAVLGPSVWRKVRRLTLAWRTESDCQSISAVTAALQPDTDCWRSAQSHADSSRTPKE